MLFRSAEPVLAAATAMTNAARDIHTLAMSMAQADAFDAFVGGRPMVWLGLLLHQLADGRWAASEVFAGGAAATAGIQPGDVVLSVDGRAVQRGWPDLIATFGAAEGTTAAVVIERAGAQRPLTLGLVAVAMPVLEWRMLPGAVGLIRLRACTASDDARLDSTRLVAGALAALAARKATRLVLDLRENGGGTTAPASLFTTADPLMNTVGADGELEPMSRDADQPLALTTRLPIAVLVNESSASAAEMIALALRDTLAPA